MRKAVIYGTGSYYEQNGGRLPKDLENTVRTNPQHRQFLKNAVSRCIVRTDINHIIYNRPKLFREEHRKSPK